MLPKCSQWRRRIFPMKFPSNVLWFILAPFFYIWISKIVWCKGDHFVVVKYKDGRVEGCSKVPTTVGVTDEKCISIIIWHSVNVRRQRDRPNPGISSAPRLASTPWKITASGRKKLTRKKRPQAPIIHWCPLALHSSFPSITTLSSPEMVKKKKSHLRKGPFSIVFKLPIQF